MQLKRVLNDLNLLMHKPILSVDNEAAVRLAQDLEYKIHLQSKISVC